MPITNDEFQKILKTRKDGTVRQTLNPDSAAYNAYRQGMEAQRQAAMNVSKNNEVVETLPQNTTGFKMPQLQAYTPFDTLPQNFEIPKAQTPIYQEKASVDYKALLAQQMSKAKNTLRTERGKNYNQFMNQGVDMSGTGDLGYIGKIATKQNVGGILTAGEALGQVAFTGDTAKAQRQFYDQTINNTNADAGSNAGQIYGNYKKLKKSEKLKTDGIGYKVLDSANKDLEKLFENKSGTEQFIDGTIISMLQNLELMPIRFIPGIGEGAAEAITLATMSASAGGNTVYQKSQQGKSLNDAFISGLIDGSIEAATEKIGVDNWVEALTGKGEKSLLKILATQGLSEGGEEFLGYLANYVVDLARKEPDAKFSRQELLQATAQGALSGVLLGGGSAIAGNIANAPTSVNNEITNAQSVETPVADNVTNTASEMKNAPQNTEQIDTENTVVNDNPKTHTQEELKIIEEYKNNIDGNLVNFIEDTKNGKYEKPYVVHTLTENEKNKLAQIAGLEKIGKNIEIDENAINHILKRHGENGVHDSSMKNIEDIARMRYVLNNYDNVEFDPTTAKGYSKANGKPAPKLVFTKKVNGTYYIVEAVSDSKKNKNNVVTAYMSKKIEALHPSMANGNNTTGRDTAKPLNASASTDNITQSIPESQEKSKKKVVPIKTRTENGIRNYISEQASIDIDKYRSDRTRQFDSKQGINVEWNDIPKTEQNQLMRLSQAYGGNTISIEENGAGMKLIRLLDNSRRSDTLNTTNSTNRSISEENIKRLETAYADEKIASRAENNSFMDNAVANYNSSQTDIQNIKNIVARSGKIIAELKNLFNTNFNPNTLTPKNSLDLLYEMKGDRESALYQLQQTSKEAKRFFDKRSTRENLDFWKNYESGIKQPTAELQAYDDYIRKVIEPLTQELEKMGMATRDNYLAHLWKDSNNKVSQAFQLNSKRNLEGNKNFTKQRIYDTLIDGINAGLTPVTLNPIAVMENVVVQETRYITANKMMQGLKDMGYAKYVDITKPIPDGYVAIDDKIAKSYFPIQQINKTGLVGQWVVDKGTGAWLHNWLMENNVRNSEIGSALADMKNGITQLELAFSGFHWVQTYMSALAESYNISLQQLVNAKDFNGAVRALNLAKTQKDGINLMRLAANPDAFMNDPANAKWLKANPDAKDMIKLAFDSGLKLSSNNYEDMGTKFTDATIGELVKQGKILQGTQQAMFKASSLVTKNLFETVIPAFKLGYFCQQMSLEMQTNKAKIANGEITVKELGRGVIDSMDDIFGAMNYDNRNWNKNLKTILQTVFRSPTWWYGNVHMGVGIANETINNAKALVTKGEKVTLGRNTGFAMGIVISSAVIGSMINLILTGEPPKDWKDMIAPRTGETNKNGDPARLSAPGYIKSWIGLYTNPKSSVTSATSGMFDLFFRLANNKDYYGNYIHDPSDDLIKQTKQIAEYLRKETAVPFTISNIVEDYKNNTENGKTDVAQLSKDIFIDMWGLSKAPDIITTSKFKRDVAKAYENSFSANSTPNSTNTAEQRKEKADLRTKIFEGKATDEEIKKAIENGTISLQSAKNAKLYTFTYQWTHLSKTKRDELWNRANLEEKKVLAEVEEKRTADQQCEGYKKAVKSGTLKTQYAKKAEKAKAYKNLTAEQKSDAGRFYQKWQNAKLNTSYTDKDVDNDYNAVSRVSKAGYSEYEAVAIRFAIKDIEGDKDSNGKTIKNTRTRKRVSKLISMGYSNSEAEKIVNAYENK